MYHNNLPQGTNMYSREYALQKKLNLVVYYRVVVNGITMYCHDIMTTLHFNNNFRYLEGNRIISIKTIN
jgi:hypothetical protein